MAAQQEPPRGALHSNSRHCVALPQACLRTFKGGGPSVWRKQWKGGINRNSAPKQLHLYVAGLAPAELDSLVRDRAIPIVKEPLFPNRLRHIEKDLSHLPLGAAQDRGLEPGAAARERLLAAASAAAKGTPFAWGGKELTMVWPQWENGFGDVIAHTLLPLAEYAADGPIRSPLAVSGLKYPILARLLTAVAPHACASERPNPPLLPHCNASCYETIHLCGLDHAWVRVCTSARRSSRRLALSALVRTAPPADDAVLVAGRVGRGGHPR
jgi:hypothetical protein